MVSLNDLAGGYTSFSNTLVTDVLTCAKCAVHLLIHGSGVTSVQNGLGQKYQPLLEELVHAGGVLTIVVLKELSGLTDPSRRVATGDMRVAEGVYNEVQACLTFVASAFSAGIVTADLKQAVEISQGIFNDCRNSLSVQTSWLQAVLCAISCLMLARQDEDQEKVGARILAVKMAQMKAKMNDDEQGEVAAEALLNANVFLEGNAAAEKAVDFEAEGDKKKKRKKLKQHTFHHDNSSAVSTVGASTGAPSVAVSMLGGGDDDDDDVSVESLTDWKEENRDEDDRILDGEQTIGGTGKDEFGEDNVVTLSHVLHRSGETNMQSPEVMEQWLLLIHHLAGWSPLARQTLVNASVDIVVAKVSSVQLDHVYLIALCELCVSLIRTEEEEHFEL
ncbi:unnamed protein product [Symbiodinium microadriaticum]|nr:unnamed protein product [Symbiodinium microadriaticum]